jgi:tetratricopeptide (TPR) repeat protein
LDALAQADLDTDVRAVFSWSYRTLSPDAALLFRLLGLHPGADFAVSAAASIAGVPAARARVLLADLISVGLITEYVAGRYRLHDLLRAYAIEMTHAQDTDEERRLAVHRALDHYLHSAHRADRLLGPRPDPIPLAAPLPETTARTFSGPATAMTWFSAERLVLSAAIDRAAAAGFDVHAWQLAWTLTTFLQRRGAWREWAVTQQAGLAASRRLGDRSAQACAHRLLGYAFARLGQIEDAGSHLRSALELYRQLGDHANQARVHLVLAWLLDGHDRAAVLDHLRQAGALHRPLRPVVGPPDALDRTCPHHAHRDEHRRIIEPYRQAIALLQESADRSSQAVAWLSLGRAQDRLHHHTQAVACYQYAIDVFHEFGDQYLEAETLTHLGDTHLAAGRADQARHAWRRALAILSELKHPAAVGIRSRLHDTGADSTCLHRSDETSQDRHEDP